jgi:hypothetical protein
MSNENRSIVCSRTALPDGKKHPHERSHYLDRSLHIRVLQEYLILVQTSGEFRRLERWSFISQLRQSESWHEIAKYSVCSVTTSDLKGEWIAATIPGNAFYSISRRARLHLCNVNIHNPHWVVKYADHKFRD